MVPRRLFSRTATPLVVLGLFSAGATAAPISFTGNVANDFNPQTNPAVKVISVSDNPLTIGQSDWITNRGWVSGWSIQDIRLSYDQVTDTLAVGINNFKNASGQVAPFGQANGDPTGTATAYDVAHMGGDKSIALAIAGVNASNSSTPGAPVIIAGVPADKSMAGTGTDGFTVSSLNTANSSSGLAYEFGKQLPQYTGNLAYDPSPSHPQLEFTIKNFSQIAGLDLSKGIWLSMYAGSSQDGVAGEAYLDWTKTPALAEQNTPEPTTWLAWTVACGAAAYRYRGRRKDKRA
ncbi:hypothetical protein OJF2_48440 [Aquisphaera giovannonii]|uniref:PEP-CTERM protein-sorting domain-containing protein n=1 Tax=Aquisphaera giovannonii TaxID=406548 RepID=A0A5B9W7R7_9BACT|nr:hypothetical protein [Aquisphaera giovannonii]QEH36284.1 hypothetical protein OJF2_48440 [Aquisphaera giovannonii]